MQRFRTLISNARQARFIVALASGLAYSLLFAFLLALIACLLDWGFCFESFTRHILRLIVILLPLCFFIRFLFGAVKAAKQFPAELDALAKDERCSISNANQLAHEIKDDGSLKAWLASCTIEEGAKALLECRKNHKPFYKLLAKVFVVIAASHLIFWGCYLASPRALETLGNRLFCPSADIPPFSPYTFEIEPEAPVARYGESLQLAVRVTGDAPQPENIQLWLDIEGLPIQKLPCFADHQGRWLRQLEKMTTPCRIAFATEDGRARSKFVPVEISYRPRIVSGTARIKALAYTGMEEKIVALGGSEVLVPDGGQLFFELESNRDLSAGYAEFTPSGSKEAYRIEGKVAGKKLSLDFSVRQPGILAIQVEDQQGRPADSPLQTRIGVMPDMIPQVSISSPEDQSYVVEGYPLEIVMEATDDYGINRLDLYKALLPYRQHATSEFEKKAAELRVVKTIDTKALGLKPNEKLELRAEVSDENPFRYNLVSSGTTTVTVISEADYADLLRAEMTYQEFLARYELLEEARANAQRSIEAYELAQTPEEKETALKGILESHQSLKEMALSIATDFPIFDMDKKLSEIAQKIADQVDLNIAQAALLPNLEGEPLEKALQEMLERVKSGDDLKEELDEARVIAMLAELEERKAQFDNIIQRQAELVQLIGAFAEDANAQESQMEGLASEQADIQREYEECVAAIPGLIARMEQTQETAKLAEELTGISQKCEAAGVSGLMQQAADSAVARKLPDAQVYAQEALDAMLEINEDMQSEGMENAAQEAKEQMSQAAQQAMEQLMEKSDCEGEGAGDMPGEGEGEGEGQGQGQGKSKGDSNKPGKQSPKAAGPKRAKPGQGQGTGGKEGKSTQSDGNKQGSNNGGQIGSEGAEGTDGDMGSEGEDAGASLESVPPAYRDAVRSYFKQ